MISRVTIYNTLALMHNFIQFKPLNKTQQTNTASEMYSDLERTNPKKGG